MTTTISNLPRDLIEEIFSRIPLKSVKALRLTCKRWDTLSKSETFTKKHIVKAATTREGESMMIAMMDCNLYIMSVFVDNLDHPSIELKGKLTCLNEQVKISRVFHCEGLLLCILKDDNRFADTRLVVWNPYLGQTRWIEPRYSHRPNGWDRFVYALGYVDKMSCRSVKFLRFIDYYYEKPESQFLWYEIYDFDSDSWKTLDVTPHWCIVFCDHGVSLKGNTYWPAKERNSISDFVDHIICFDFTRERFGPLLPLPFIVMDHEYQYVTLSCVGEEKLAALFQHDESNPYEFEVWITTEIEAENVLWSKFLTMETEHPIMVPHTVESYFIEEEKKIVMGFNEHYPKTFNIIGEDGYLRKLDLGKHAEPHCRPFVCSYVPSLVQIKKPAVGETRKESSLEDRVFDQNMLRLAAFEEEARCKRTRY